MRHQSCRAERQFIPSPPGPVEAGGGSSAAPGVGLNVAPSPGERQLARQAGSGDKLA